MHTTPASKWTPKWLLLPPVALAVVLVAPVCFDEVRETDVGWHLALGRLIATEGIPFRNALSWTVPEQPWYATSWLFDLIAWVATDRLGVLGLQLWTLLLVTLTLAGTALAASTLDRRGAWWTPLLALLLVPRITERPHLVSWAVLAWVMALGLLAQNRDREGREGWKLRLAAVGLIALGSNFHAGAVFAAGALGVFCLEAWLLGGQRREWLLAGAACLALLANPGWTYSVSYAIEHLGVQRVIRLAEFESPTLARAWMFYLLMALALAIAWRFRRERPAMLVLVVVFAALGGYALRLVYKAEIVAVIVLALGLAEVRRRVGARVEILLLALVLISVGGLRLRFYKDLRINPAFDARALPVGAAEFIREAGLDGRVFNGFRDGGHLAFALPQLPIFQDARVQAYPPEFFARQEEAERSSEAFATFLREQEVEWALTSRVKEPLTGHGLLGGPEWALVHWDAASEIWVRRDVDRLAQVRERFELSCFHPHAPLLRELGGRDRAGLEACEAEVARFERHVTGDPFAALVRCALESRLRPTTAEPTCRTAHALAPDEALQRLIARVSALPPVE